MTKTIEILKVEELAGDKFVTIKWSEGEDVCQETIATETLVELAASGIEVIYDEENEALEGELVNAQIEYVEISEEEDGEFDVYYHEAKISFGEVVINIEGEFKKTFKTRKGAENFARKLSNNIVG